MCGAVALVVTIAACGNQESEPVEAHKALGERISAAQGPAIDQMYALLQGWGAPIAGEDSMGGMDMGGTDQEAAMTELEAVTGADFDRSFLQLMIEHHRSALKMAETELAAGESPQALELAQTIIDAQEAEIAEMEQLLQSL